MDYESEFVYMIPLKHEEITTFYEDINIVPARIRGAIITNNEKNKKKLHFQILDPAGNEVLGATTKEYIFDFTTHLTGRFSFSFENYKVKAGMAITFTMSCGQNDLVQKADMTFSEQRIDHTMHFYKQMHTELKLRRNLHNERYKRICILNLLTIG